VAARELAGKGRRAGEQSSRENREGGERGRQRGPGWNFSKVQGIHCKVKLSFKQ
jgi:hypothetical protein